MIDNQNEKYVYYTKVAWAIYALITIVIAAVLVLFVAQDNEERFFFGLMTVSAAYVFRPGNKTMSRYILKHTGVSQPTEKE